MHKKDEPTVDYTAVRERSAVRSATLIVDMDGTLALMNGRKPFDYDRVHEDLPNVPVVFAVKGLSCFATILVVSGREETCRQATEDWLHRHEIFFHKLFMRPVKDYRPDTVIKSEIYEREIKGVYTNIIGCFDDRPSVIRFWESLGLFVFNCNNGRGEF